MHKVVTHSRTLSSSCSDSYFLNQNRCRFRLRVDVFLRKSYKRWALIICASLLYCYKNYCWIVCLLCTIVMQMTGIYLQAGEKKGGLVSFLCLLFFPKYCSVRLTPSLRRQSDRDPAARGTDPREPPAVAPEGLCHLRSPIHDPGSDTADVLWRWINEDCSHALCVHWQAGGARLMTSSWCQKMLQVKAIRHGWLESAKRLRAKWLQLPAMSGLQPAVLPDGNRKAASVNPLCHRADLF